ncbi:MAG: hypothetical protein EAX86_00900 [Candidatus Heimdallarchaeota archaeon]|nr:hypothetical protein [Candidatus Heimdallarchaeota archaeon]
MVTNIISFVLDTTVFIRLDFPRILELSVSTFYTTNSVILELKDFRSRSNRDILIQINKLVIEEPNPIYFKEVIAKIRHFDPVTSLSRTDIDVLTLAYQKKVAIITNDLNLQNIAANIGIPFFIVTGKRIKQKIRWKLRCLSCNKILSQADSLKCPLCGGNLKKIRTSINNELKRKSK